MSDFKPNSQGQHAQSKAEQLAALRAQRSKINAEIRELDPSAARTNVKRDNAMSALKEMIKQGKEPKKVGWMNSAKSADHEINVIDKTRPKPKYPNWQIEEQDLDGDNVMDVVIKDQTGKIRGVNGYSVERTSFPNRKPYYDAYPRPDQRRKVINGEENPHATTKKKFDQLRSNNTKGVRQMVIGQDENGNDIYGFVYNDINAKRNPTPYKVFLHLLLKPYWDNYAKEIAEGEGVPKHLILTFYNILKRRAWNLLKNNIHSKLNTPHNISDKELQSYESSSRFKQELNLLVSDILKQDEDNQIRNLQSTLYESLEELKGRDPFGRQQPPDEDEDEEFLQ